MRHSQVNRSTINIFIARFYVLSEAAKLEIALIKRLLGLRVEYFESVQHVN